MTDEMKNSSQKCSIQFPRRQYFSLPFGLVSYLLETESPHLFLKLQKSCKHFFAKKRVILFGKTIYVNHSSEVYCFKNGTSFKIVLDKGIKYWFTRIRFDSNYSILCSHIYRLTLTKLMMSWQDLSQNDIDFLFFDNKIKTLEFFKVVIRNDVGNPVPIDYILGKVPKVKKIYYWNRCEIYSNELLKKLNSIQFNQKLIEFRLLMQQTSEEIDAEILGEFVKRNLASDGEVTYEFPKNAPELETVRTKLRQSVDDWVSNDGKKLRYLVGIVPQ